MARVVVQDRCRDRPGMRPDHGLPSRPLAPPQPRHPAMRKVTPPVAHRADMHAQNRRNLPSLPPFQCQQNRPRPIRFAAVLRFRQVTQHRPFRSISRELRFSRHTCLHSSHLRQTIQSIAHSRALCLVAIGEREIGERYPELRLK